MFEQQKNRKLRKNENWKNRPKRSKIGNGPKNFLGA